MKWFMATNEQSLQDDQFYHQIVVAVRSALKNTSLEPFLVYDGKANERISELQSLGVTILYYNLTFRKQVEEYVLANYPYNDDEKRRMVVIKTGAFLRIEMPQLIRDSGVEDEFVLYTDCDVLFVNDVDFSRIRPSFFASFGLRQGGYTRWNIGGWMHFNSGVMLMHVENMVVEQPGLIDFILNNGYNCNRPDSRFMRKNLIMDDQVALNLYFKGRISKLKPVYNWHPTRGINESARIVHFNGLKWTEWDDFIEELLRPDRQKIFSKLVNKNRESYLYYVDLARSMLN